MRLQVLMSEMYICGWSKIRFSRKCWLIKKSYKIAYKNPSIRIPNFGVQVNNSSDLLMSNVTICCVFLSQILYHICDKILFLLYPIIANPRESQGFWHHFKIQIIRREDFSVDIDHQFFFEFDTSFSQFLKMYHRMWQMSAFFVF